MKKERRKLIKFSNYSLCVTLPKWVVKDLGWEKGEVVDMSVDAKKGTILVSKGVSELPNPTNTTEELTPELESSARW